jgi:hypothetical protein
MYDREEMEIQEKAPPGAKYERMVKHIKKSLAKNGLTDKEKAIAYATTWKSYNKTHKEEVEQIDEIAPLVAAGLAAGGIGLAANAIGRGMKKFVDTHSNTKPSDYKNQQGLGANLAKKREMLQKNSYQPEGEMVDEGKQSFPAKKVAKQMEKARKGSVYGRETENKPNPNTTDSEKKNTTRFSKMFHASEKAKREKQNADKERRSSTFYKDTHPASPAKMKKANEEFEILDERRKEDKVAGTPRKPRDKAFELVAKSMGTGRMGVKPRGEKKEPGKKPPVAGEYGGPASPAQKVAKRRADAQRAQDMMHSRFDHFEMDGDDLQEKYLYTYLYERNYDALDKDADGDKDFADVMIARMIASGKSREDAIKATMSKDYNKKGKKVKISDEFSDWRIEMGEELAKKSPFVDVMPKDDTSTDESESLKAARKRQQPNQKVTAESLEQFADSIGGYLVEAEQIDESILGRVVTTAFKTATKAAKPSLKLGTEKAGALAVVRPAEKAVERGVKTSAIVKAKPKTTAITKAKPKTTAITKAETKTSTLVKQDIKTGVPVKVETSAKELSKQKPKVIAAPADIKTGGTKPPGGGGVVGGPKGRGFGGPIPIPGLPKLNYQHVVGYTQNPQ